jgi:hypothetical protein
MARWEKGEGGKEKGKEIQVRKKTGEARSKKAREGRTSPKAQPASRVKVNVK